jgi:hypothetical protein
MDARAEPEAATVKAAMETTMEAAASKASGCRGGRKRQADEGRC